MSFNVVNEKGLGDYNYAPFTEGHEMALALGPFESLLRSEIKQAATGELGRLGRKRFTGQITARANIIRQDQTKPPAKTHYVVP